MKLKRLGGDLCWWNEAGKTVTLDNRIATADLRAEFKLTPPGPIPASSLRPQCVSLDCAVWLLFWRTAEGTFALKMQSIALNWIEFNQLNAVGTLRNGRCQCFLRVGTDGDILKNCV